jgi:hypothetical protein
MSLACGWTTRLPDNSKSRWNILLHNILSYAH